MRLSNGYINRRPLMERDGSGVSALVGLDGFVVRAQLLEESTGEWWLAVGTTEGRAWCQSCGVRAVGHGRRRAVVRDHPLADRPVVRVWSKRRWHCPEPACPAMRIAPGRHVVRMFGDGPVRVGHGEPGNEPRPVELGGHGPRRGDGRGGPLSRFAGRWPIVGSR